MIRFRTSFCVSRMLLKPSPYATLAALGRQRHGVLIFRRRQPLCILIHTALFNRGVAANTMA